MFKILIGIIFIIAGAGALLGAGRPQPDIATGLIATAIGVYLIYRSVKNTPSAHQEASFTPPGDVVKTFSFQAVGFRFKCRFPNGRFDTRQSVLSRSHVGDIITLRQYEWEGKPAFALMSQRCNADLGSAPAGHVNTILELAEKYNVVGKIISIDHIEYRREPYITCDIELSCFSK